MINPIIDAKYLKDYKVFLLFHNGEKGVVDLHEKIQGKKGVFIPLKNINAFKKFKVANHTLSWDNGADLAPESLYDLLMAQNSSSAH
ncbi:MAG: DUF2442 domain-containing protein [Alphaproteobacteria bacterium]|nr:DUF2442 domain-containing protein [Alphaproteobacteria bacterium]